MVKIIEEPIPHKGLTPWERAVWERYKIAVEGNRGSFNILAYERLTGQIQLLEQMGLA